MYKSPIDVVYKELQVQMKEDIDKAICEAVQQCEIHVDKDELIKALQYDRNQYEKGYKDARRKYIEMLLLDVHSMKVSQDSENQDYKTGFICALSNVEGMLAIMLGGV